MCNHIRKNNEMCLSELMVYYLGLGEKKHLFRYDPFGYGGNALQTLIVWYK